MKRCRWPAEAAEADGAAAVSERAGWGWGGNECLWDEAGEDRGGWGRGGEGGVTGRGGRNGGGRGGDFLLCFCGEKQGRGTGGQERKEAA